MCVRAVLDVLLPLLTHFRSMREGWWSKIELPLQQLVVTRYAISQAIVACTKLVDFARAVPIGIRVGEFWFLFIEKNATPS